MYSTPLYPYLSPHVAIAERCGVASRCPARDTRYRTLHYRGATAKRQCLSTLMRVMHGRATRTWPRSRQPSRPSGAYPGRASLVMKTMTNNFTMHYFFTLCLNAPHWRLLKVPAAFVLGFTEEGMRAVRAPQVAAHMSTQTTGRPVTNAAGQRAPSS